MKASFVVGMCVQMCACVCLLRPLLGPLLWLKFQRMITSKINQISVHKLVSILEAYAQYYMNQIFRWVNITMP